MMRSTAQRASVVESNNVVCRGIGGTNNQIIKSGVAGSLQGFYGRKARALIENGYLSENGDIL